MPDPQSWLVWALLSAVFAAATAILAKIARGHRLRRAARAQGLGRNCMRVFGRSVAQPETVGVVSDYPS